MEDEHGVKGGQGRWPHELNDAATWVVCVLFLSLVIILVFGRH
jgi:hypothetical protein